MSEGTARGLPSIGDQASHAAPRMGAYTYACWSKGESSAAKQLVNGLSSKVGIYRLARSKQPEAHPNTFAAKFLTVSRIPVWPALAT